MEEELEDRAPADCARGDEEKKIIGEFVQEYEVDAEDILTTVDLRLEQNDSVSFQVDPAPREIIPLGHST